MIFSWFSHTEWKLIVWAFGKFAVKNLMKRSNILEENVIIGNQFWILNDDTIPGSESCEYFNKITWKFNSGFQNLIISLKYVGGFSRIKITGKSKIKKKIFAKRVFEFTINFTIGCCLDCRFRSIIEIFPNFQIYLQNWLF
jgi:hypothetical protein